MFAQGGNGGGGSQDFVSHSPATSKFALKQSIEMICLHVFPGHWTILCCLCHNRGSEMFAGFTFKSSTCPKPQCLGLQRLMCKTMTLEGKGSDSKVLCSRFWTLFNTYFSVFLRIKVSWQVFKLCDNPVEF